MKQALVCGAGGFIGGHLVKRLKREGFWVRGVDIKFHEHAETEADDFAVGDLREQDFCRAVIDRRFDEVYQLAADMGGAGYIFTGEHDADVMHNSATINLNVLEACRKRTSRSSSIPRPPACIPAYNQIDPDNPKCSEDSAYPAAPDSEYGWEKLFSERLYLAYRRNHGMKTSCRALPQYLRAGRHLDRRQGEGAGGDVPQGRRGRGRRRDRDLGRRRTDAVVPLYRRVPGGRTRGCWIRLRRACQYRLRGDGDDQPAGRHDRRYRRQADREAHRRGRWACGGGIPTTG